MHRAKGDRFVRASELPVCDNADLVSVECIWAPDVLGCFPFWVGGSVVVDSLLSITAIMGFCNCSMFCCALLYVHSSFAIILLGKRELVALLSLFSWCLMIVVWLYLTVPWV